MDVPIFAVDFYEKFGYDRPIYTLSHDMLFSGPTGDFFMTHRLHPGQSRERREALRSGGLVVVFPGGDYDVYRPTVSENVIDFGGRTGYVRTAIEAGVPIVPTVSIGGQENQLYLSRGTWLAKRLGPIARLARTKILPISFGFPFGLSAGDPAQPAAAHQDRHPGAASRSTSPPSSATTPTSTRSTRTCATVMQRALDELARQRRFPVLG